MTGHSAPRDRFLSLDVVRGVAVMGILTMNVTGFAGVQAFYFNPHAQGPASSADVVAFLTGFVLFDGKMRGLFSFLFGASMLLVIGRVEAAGGNAARVHFARMGWLLAFGLAHLWLVWWGDILHQYAIVGMAAWFLRDRPTHKLIAAGLVLLCLQAVMMAGAPFAVAMAEQGLPDPASAGRTLAELSRGFGIPDDAWLAEQVATHRGGYADILAERWATHATTPLTGLYFAAETLAYMLFGMVALRSGFITGQWDRARYGRWLAVGFGLGLPLYVLLALYQALAGFGLFATLLAQQLLSIAVRPLMIVGWASAILLAMRPDGWWTARVAAVGRMAFTNYLAMSAIGTTIFYGYALGWFASLSRIELWPIVLAVWAAMLCWSKPWVDRFAYGPVEWLWRSLTFGALQRFLRPTRDKNANAPQ